MKASQKTIEYLNKVLTLELTSINQYFLHARMFKNWGFAELNEQEYKKSIQDMKQADKLVERILFLEGLPNLQALNALRIGENTEEMLSCDMTFQHEERSLLQEAIAFLETEKDYVSREILVEILEYEEAHIDWIETQQDLISSTGLQNYLQTQMAD